jgi:cytochrome-b5 reductase
MSLSCAFTTSLTLAASAYDIFGIFGLTAKQPLLSTLNLSTCACILDKDDLHDREGKLEGVIRPYTPISTNSQIGSFDLLIKNYGENGRMSTHLCNLKEGAEVSFEHIDFNVKIQAPFPCKKLYMLVGGTGISPPRPC